VQVMVEQPLFYYRVVPIEIEPIADGKGYHMRRGRYYVSDKPKAGFKIHPAFIVNGEVKDKIYLAAYEGCLYDKKSGEENYLLHDEAKIGRASCRERVKNTVVIAIIKEKW